MPYCIVSRNAHPDDNHEVHHLSTGCNYMPSVGNRVDLGVHDTCHGVVNRAILLGYARVNGCFWCANKCHIT